MRLFIAVNFTPGIKNRLSDVIEELKKKSVKGNFTRVENLHLTIVFIGETTKINLVKQAMDGISAPAFTLMIKGFGCFPREGGSIYWLGIEKNETLNSIYEELNKELLKNGFSLEKRGFKPHLTIGREVALNKGFNREEFIKSITPMEMKVDGISLMKSERLGGKLVYTEIHKKELVQQRI